MSHIKLLLFIGITVFSTCVFGVEEVSGSREGKQYSFSSPNDQDYQPGLYHQPSQSAKNALVQKMTNIAFDELQERADVGDYDYKDPYLEDTAAFIAVTAVSLYAIGLTIIVITVFYTSAVATATTRKRRDIEDDSRWVTILEDLADCTTEYLCEVDRDLEKKRKASKRQTETQRKGKELLLHRCDDLKTQCPVDVHFVLNIVRYLSKFTDHQL